MFSLFGHQVKSVELDLSAGQDLVVRTVSMPAISPSSEDQAQITGNVIDLSSGKPVTKGRAEVDANPRESVPLDSNGAYVVTGLAPGVHTVTVTAAGFEAVTVVVDVAIDSIAIAPLSLLPPLDTLSGTVLSNSGGVVPAAFVSLAPAPVTERCGVAANPSAPATGLALGPDGVTRGCYADGDGGYRIVGLPHGTYTVDIQSPHAPGTADPSVIRL